MFTVGGGRDGSDSDSSQLKDPSRLPICYRHNKEYEPIVKPRIFGSMRTRIAYLSHCQTCTILNDVLLNPDKGRRR